MSLKPHPLVFHLHSPGAAEARGHKEPTAHPDPRRGPLQRRGGVLVLGP